LSAFFFIQINKMGEILCDDDDICTLHTQSDYSTV